MMSTGGLSVVKDGNEEVQNLCNSVKAEVENMAKAEHPFANFKVISFKTQVVAGTMYYVKILIASNQYIHVKLFQSLPHAGSKVTVEGVQGNKSASDDINFF